MTEILKNTVDLKPGDVWISSAPGAPSREKRLILSVLHDEEEHIDLQYGKYHKIRIIYLACNRIKKYSFPSYSVRKIFTL